MKEKYPENAIYLLNKYFPKGNKKRGEAMAILSLAFLEGREIGKKEKKRVEKTKFKWW